MATAAAGRRGTWRMVLGAASLSLFSIVLFLARNRRLASTSASATPERTAGGGAAASDAAAPNGASPDVEDGCGAVGDRRSSRWTALPERVKGEAAAIRTCLLRHGRFDKARAWATPVGEVGLNCSADVAVEAVRATLSRYGTVWLHGDSVMKQAFYTLACMLNSSVALPWAMAGGGGLGKARQKTGLGYDGIEKFAYRHAGGSTRFIYSRFGALWDTDANFYKHDFPLAVRTLTPNDAILVNVAFHVLPSKPSGIERAMTFMAEQSLVANATVFYLEPHPEEWPTSNGMFTKSCPSRCDCERLSDARLSGRGEFARPANGTVDQKYATSTGKPDAPFFRRLYPDDRTWENDTEGCVPNCLPATWRVDFVRTHLARVRHRIRVVPIFWQLASREDGHSGRGRGDCTHKNLYATMLMIFQWIRTIVGSNGEHFEE
ncbi:hypothetical protein ACHAWF_006699 [Thalassiosira exigua]